MHPAPPAPRKEGNTSAPPLNIVLAALEGLRQYGDAYRADCPVGHKSRGTLTIAEGNEGQVLVKCFAGCSFQEIASAAGLSVFDFFPPRPLDTPEQRRKAKQRRREADWAAALRVLAHESVVLVVLANDLHLGPLDESGRERLRLATTRITLAREALA